MGGEVGFVRPWGWQWTPSGQNAPNATPEPIQLQNEQATLQHQMNSLQAQMNAIQNQLAKLSPPSEDQPSE
jgi:uncharacterized protein YlxW (UPF0749 family)